MNRGNHRIEQDELMAYLDGELSTDCTAAVVGHLEQCPECRRLAADLREVSHKLRSWEIVSSSAVMTQAVTTALDEQERKRLSPISFSPAGWRAILRMRPSYAWAAALAAVSVVVVMGISLIGTNANYVFRTETAPDRSAPTASPGQAGKISGSIGQLEAPPNGPVSGNRDRLQTFAQLQSPPKTSDSAGGSLPIASGPMIVRTAKLTLTTREFDRARAGLEEVLKRHRGYFGELNVSAPVGAARTLIATLHVPAHQLEATMTELRQLGRVESESQAGEDVTSQYVDLQARLANARHTEQRLTDVLQQRTGKLGDVLAVENEISRVRGEIEQMEAERKNLANQVDFATVSATVTEDYKAQLQVVPPSTSMRFRNAAVDGYRNMVADVIGIALFLVSDGPRFLFWGGLLFFPTRSVWKRIRRAIAQ